MWQTCRVTAGSPQREGAEWFSAPAQLNRRRYEALRAWFTEGLTYEQAAQRFGYTRWAMVGLVREFRAGKLDLFAAPRRPGPPPGTAPARTGPAAGSSSCGGRACPPVDLGPASPARARR